MTSINHIGAVDEARALVDEARTAKPRGLPEAPSINPPVSRARDPIALAGITVKAVDQIGEAAAAEIEDAAESIQRAALEIGNKLRRLAGSVREHSRIAGESVADFCAESTDVIETVRGLQSRIDGAEKIGNGQTG